MLGLVWPCAGGFELCPSGRGTSSGECCLPQLGFSPAGKKTAPKGKVAPVTCLALQRRRWEPVYGCWESVYLIHMHRVGEGGASSLTPPHLLPYKKHSCFPSCMLQEVGEGNGDYLELLTCTPPLAISFQRTDSASLSGLILQPQEVEATAAVDQSARTGGGLAESLLPAGQTLSPQPGTSGFPRPQNCP